MQMSGISDPLRPTARHAEVISPVNRPGYHPMPLLSGPRQGFKAAHRMRRPFLSAWNSWVKAPALWTEGAELGLGILASTPAPASSALEHPVVALLLQLQRQLLAAGFHDATVHEDVDEVGNDVVEQSLVMRDD